MEAKYTGRNNQTKKHTSGGDTIRRGHYTEETPYRKDIHAEGTWKGHTQGGRHTHGVDSYAAATYLEGTCIRRGSAHEGRREIHMDEHTYGEECTWKSIHTEEHTHGGKYTWRGHIHCRRFLTAYLFCLTRNSVNENGAHLLDKNKDFGWGA